MATAGLFAQSCSLDDAAKIPLVELGAPTKEFIVESLAGDVAIPVYSNGAFHVENVAEGQEWIALDKWEGNGDDTLYVEYTFNEEFKRMAGLVLCSDVDERRDTIYIKQKGLIEASLGRINLLSRQYGLAPVQLIMQTQSTTGSSGAEYQPHHVQVGNKSLVLFL